VIATEPPVPAPGGARWRSCLWDYLAIVVWIAFVTAAGLLVRTWCPVDVSAAPLLLTDTVAFVSTVLPVWVYLTWSEAGVRQAGWGKRRAGLRVMATSTSARVGLWRAALRNGVKLLPWQLAHLAVARLILSVDAPLLIVTTYVLSLAVPVVSLVVCWRDPQRRALHDFAAGTRVVLVGERKASIHRADLRTLLAARESPP
jgi:uncharacterized RDD family membrane protein YckC